MNKLVVVNICIFLLHIIFILVNLTTAKKGLRDSSSCRYSGGADYTGGNCHREKVKIRKLPEECSAFIIDGVKFARPNTIVDRYEETILIHLKELIEEDDSSHDVYVFYNHEDNNTLEKIFPEYFQAEAKALKDFIGIYPVKGLILNGIEEPFDFKASGDFYKYLKAYVTAIKTENPCLEIGFYLSASTLIVSVVDELGLTMWFDFNQMNDIFDFYIFEFSTFNECTDELLRDGITPFDSSNSAVMTLNQFADSFKKSTIDKEKVYFEFLIMPAVKFLNITQFPLQCEISYTEYCKNYDKYKSIWCVDTQDMLVKKGQFSKTHSKGFIARDIDAVDRDEKCDCPSQYVTFFMMLNGYNCDKNPMTCEKFK